MAKVDFFPVALRPTLGELAAMSGSTAQNEAAAERRYAGVAPLDLAGPDHLAFFENRRYLAQLRETRAGAV